MGSEDAAGGAELSDVCGVNLGARSSGAGGLLRWWILWKVFLMLFSKHQ